MSIVKDWWMPKWNHFEKQHEKLSKWIYQIACFFAFSMGVTLFQYSVCLELDLQERNLCGLRKKCQFWEWILPGAL